MVLVSALFIVSVCYLYTTGFEINNLSIIVLWTCQLETVSAELLTVTFWKLSLTANIRHHRLHISEPRGNIDSRNRSFKRQLSHLKWLEVLFVREALTGFPSGWTRNICKSLGSSQQLESSQLNTGSFIHLVWIHCTFFIMMGAF